ncbi:Uncharacterized protein SCF082_LOCUS31884 [Durusdinium trenchii]|uniref:RNase H type-1 domain-containing protein n=1 Tax=Durusdinium trenchii TaxID=1381693 RepID=A0ABP0NCI2_9DINO
MLPDRTISSKGRVIWDAKPINEFCDKKRHPPALQPKHDEVARWWQTRYLNTPILVSKKDVSDAFKWIPVRGEDTRLFAADLPGGEFGAPGRNITVLYNSLTLGWTGAPGEYMLFAWLIKTAKIGLRPWLSVQTMETCARKALGEGAINAAKDEVEGALETRKLIWGLMYDTEKNTRALPPQKLEKASYLLRLPEFDHGSTKIPLKLIQELRGNQQFWISVMPSLKPLLTATNALLGPPTSEGFAQPRGDAEQKRRIWVRFWEAIELQRLLVDNRNEWGVRFTHPMTEALTLRELLVMPGYQHKVVWASGDATLDWVPGLEDGAEAESPERLMVALTELLAVLLLAVCQHEQWKGKVILYMGDKQVVIKWINARQARRPFAGFLLQVLAAVEACYGFHLHTAYLRTYHNVVADALTRKDADEVIREVQFIRLGALAEGYTAALLASGACRRYESWALWDAIEKDAKDRVVATPDAEGEWWIAAWSGHTQDRVVGPAAIVPPPELPETLIHGTFRKHTASIQRRGLLRQSRDLHFHNPGSSSGKWRADLETCVEIDVRHASNLGCVFRRTGNDVDPKPVTEEVAQACIAPGMPDDEDEFETKVEDAEAEPMDAEGSGEGVTVSGEAEKDTVMEDSGASESHEGVEMLTPKSEEIIEEGGAPFRRRKIKFGNAHLRILRAVADADASNWESLQKVIGATPASAREKSEFFGRLEQLADLRVQSLVAAEKRAPEHAERVKHYTEAETQYQSGLNDAMLRLERMNPVGPRASVPLISDARLREDIAAGKSIRQARREHRSRARAAQHRKETAEKPTLDPSQPNRLTEVPPAAGGGVLNKAFSESAKANLKEFRQILREEAQVEATIKKRKPDSERRKKIKSDRRKEKKSNAKDDAERDHNQWRVSCPDLEAMGGDLQEGRKRLPAEEGIKGEQKQKNFCSAQPMKGRYRVLPLKPLSNEQQRGWICSVATLARILCDSEGQACFAPGPERGGEEL